MPNALVLGGSGYLGLAVSQALLRSGNYTVWGTTRSAAKAKALLANEITPVVGEATDAKFLADTVAASRIDIVIDCTSAYEEAGAILSGVVQAARARTASLGPAAQAAPKLGFVYTSGSWVHGSPGTRVNDLTVPGTALAPASPATAVAWRPAHEQAVLASRDVLDVAVLRPCAIYGRGSWVWGTWWGPLLAAARGGSTDPIQIPADKSARCGTVHVDDLAEAYVAAADNIDGRLGTWPVFDVTTETVSVVDIIEAASAALSVTAPVAYAGTSGNAFLEALSLVSNSDTSRARSVLGWRPKHRDFIQNIATIVAAWRVTQEESK